MRTMSGQKSLAATDIPNLMERIVDFLNLLAGKRISWNRRHLRSRSQFAGTARHEHGTRSRCLSGKAKAFRSPRCLPDDGSALELGNDCNRDVAKLPTTVAATSPQSFS